MLEIIRDSLMEITIVGHGTDQDGDQDKSPTDKLLSVLRDDTLSAAG